MFKSKEQAAAYLSGVIDGEGSVTITRPQGPNRAGRGFSITVWNTDLDLLRASEEAMRLLGASPKLYERKRKKEGYLGHKRSYYLRVGTRRDIEALAPHLTLYVEAKRARVEQALQHYSSSPWTPQYQWPTEELRALADTHTNKQLAQHFDVSASTIDRWKRVLRGTTARPERERPAQ